MNEPTDNPARSEPSDAKMVGFLAGLVALAVLTGILRAVERLYGVAR